MSAAGFTQLRVWQKAHQVTLVVYKIIGRMPVDERFGLTSQMRRAAVSVAANIAEGYASRGGNRARFFGIAKTSAEELKYYLILTKDLGYLTGASLPEGPLDEVCAMLYRLRENAVPGR
jgi:four helix bundle protein